MLLLVVSFGFIGAVTGCVLAGYGVQVAADIADDFASVCESLS